jgi:hypothetical protein
MLAADCTTQYNIQTTRHNFYIYLSSFVRGASFRLERVGRSRRLVLRPAYPPRFLPDGKHGQVLYFTRI